MRCLFSFFFFLFISSISEDSPVDKLNFIDVPKISEKINYGIIITNPFNVTACPPTVDGLVSLPGCKFRPLNQAKVPLTNIDVAVKVHGLVAQVIEF